MYSNTYMEATLFMLDSPLSLLGDNMKVIVHDINGEVHEVDAVTGIKWTDVPGFCKIESEGEFDEDVNMFHFAAILKVEQIAEEGD